MTEDNEKTLISRRGAIKGITMTVGTAAAGGAGLMFMSDGAAAQVASNTLESGGAISITSDGGDVTDIALTGETSFDLGWEGFDSDIDSVTFTLEAQRSQVGTGTDESTARGNLTEDTGSILTSLFSDSPTVLSPGRNGSTTYASGDLTTTFPFAIINGGSQGGNVTGTIGDANIDASSLSLANDGEVKVNEIEFTLTADVAAGQQTVTTSQTGTLDIVVDNMESTAETGGTLDGSGSGE